MKKDPALVSLSRDHHQTLSVAQELRRATERTAGKARASALAYWDEHCDSHFRLEEEVLLPAYSAHGEADHSLVARVLGDHVALREWFAGLSVNPSASAGSLRELGAELAAHVRLEERELFVLIEEALPTETLAALADALNEVKAPASG